MTFFSRKKEMKMEDFCRDFYDTQILNPAIGGSIDISDVFPDVVKKNITEAYPDFTKVDSRKLTEEIKTLRFELFALAWTHKFVSGKIVLAQSNFTKTYLYEKGRNDIWNNMEVYNNMIDSVTLHWLSNLGKVNLGFNYSMRENLTKENIELAAELDITDGSCVVRVNHRLWSENAWKQKLMLNPLAFVLCERVGVDGHKLNQEAQFRLASVVKGLYDGAQQSWDKVSFVKP